MSMFPAHSPGEQDIPPSSLIMSTQLSLCTAANVQYQEVAELASPGGSSPSTSTLASLSPGSSKGKGRESEGPELKLIRAVPVPVPGSTFFARQESLFFSQRHLPDNLGLSRERDSRPYSSGSGGPRTASAAGDAEMRHRTHPHPQAPPARPVSVHPHDARERDRSYRDGDGDVRMASQPPPPRPHSTVHGPPPHHRHPHHASPPPPPLPVRHDRAFTPLNHNPMPPPHSPHSGGDPGAYVAGAGADDDAMRRRSGKHTRRVFIQ